ncbi:cation transporter [uncultured Maricaulis sp.]|uniref:heavy-metal-associated domain-containing protein n=1 Tax=uncultured Maricaulis sp. TaxID=174710 RepID=UPI0030DBBA30|tara:strand:- start:314432 stop:314785 length:354 start_codon:yes stop_codon:yes gene_type:complete
MNNITKSILAASLVAVAGFGLAAYNSAPVEANSVAAAEQTQTATFAIDGMTCAMCPITVRTAMSRVDGVESVDIDFEAKTATVNFNPAVTTTDAIGQASNDAGYPAHVSDTPGADHP